MIEYLIEKRLAEHFSSALSAYEIQVLGTWQAMPDDQLKGMENGAAEGYLTISVQPRGYATPTIPTTTINCQVSLAMRAEIDRDGVTYLEATSAVSDVVQRWQNDLDAAVADLGVEGKFDVAGFQLAGGSASMDNQNRIWTYTQNLVVYGVVV